jgi:hypothetical protein
VCIGAGAISRDVTIYSLRSFYVHGSVHRESVSITVLQDATIYSLIYFCKLLALHVSGGNSTRHQEHIQI